MIDHFLSLFNSPIFHLLGLVYRMLAATAVIWGPILAVWLAQHLWLEYVQADYIRNKFKFVLIEVRLPRIISKTPVAMELVLQSLYQGSEPNWYERWWLGEVKPWFSLEMVSVEGDVKFLIYTPEKYRRIIESHIYAQYPDTEIVIVKDYVSLAPFNHKDDEWYLWGCEFKLTKPDPYPIKTYVDYKLDSTLTDEEMKSDPITSVIEFLGGVGLGQHVWLQILVQRNANRYQTPGKFFGKHNWHTEGKNLIMELQKKHAGEDAPKQTKYESEVISAIERSLAKVGFDCGIRAVYLAKKDHIDPSNITGIRSIFRQYNSQDLNGFRTNMVHGFDFPWQDWNGWREARQKRKLFDAYIRRSFFYAPYKKKPFVLNLEELATIYHFPGGVLETPTFARIESRKGEPPPNLPI